MDGIHTPIWSWSCLFFKEYTDQKNIQTRLTQIYGSSQLSPFRQQLLFDQSAVGYCTRRTSVCNVLHAEPTRHPTLNKVNTNLSNIGELVGCEWIFQFAFLVASQITNTNSISTQTLNKYRRPFINKTVFYYSCSVYNILNESSNP